MFGEPDIGDLYDTGDTVYQTCRNCGRDFEYTYGVRGQDCEWDECADCVRDFDSFKEGKEMVAGSWHCSDDELLAAVRETMDEHGVDTYYKNGTLYFYK